MYQQASPMGNHWHLSGIFLNPLRAWDYPKNSAFCPQKAMLAGMVHYLKGKSSIFKTGILPSGNNSSNAFVKSSTVSYSEFEI